MDTATAPEVRVAAFFPRSSPFSQAKGRNRLNQKKIANKIEAVHQRKYNAFQERAQTVIEMVGRISHEGDANEKVMLYWQLGELITREHKTNTDNPAYLDFFFQILSRDTTVPKTTLFAIERFYRVYPLAMHISPQLSWDHYRLLIDLSDDGARGFYQKMAVERSWTPGELDRAIEEGLYEKTNETKNRISLNLPLISTYGGWI